MEKGVYTVNCPGCGHCTYVHVSDTFDPNQCKGCRQEFISLEKNGNRVDAVYATPAFEEQEEEEEEEE